MNRRTFVWGLSALGLCALATTGAASARALDEVPPRPPEPPTDPAPPATPEISPDLTPPEVEVRYALDLPLTVAAAGGWWALFNAHADLARTHCPCDRDDINRLDRFAVDASFDRGERLADVATGLTFALAASGLALSTPDAQAFADDLLVVTEAVMISGLLTQGVKTAVARPYPYMASGQVTEGQEADGINYAAFWSGHTAVPMAAAVAFARLYAHRHPRSPWRTVFWIAGPALALASGALQVSAANHYPSDVIAGGLAGAAVGWGTVGLHLRW